MFEHYITIVRELFYSLTAHARQHCTIFNIKYSVTEFTIWPTIVPLYYSSIADTYSFMFAIQSMMVTLYPKEKAIR